MVGFEGSPVLHGEEGLIKMDVIEKNDESDTTTEECESFRDSDYSLEEDDMIFDKTIDSIVEWVGVNGRSRSSQSKNCGA